VCSQLRLALPVVDLPWRARQLGQRLDGTPATLKDLPLFRREMAKTFRFGGRTGLGSGGERFSLKLQSPFEVLSVDLLL